MIWIGLFLAAAFGAFLLRPVRGEPRVMFRRPMLHTNDGRCWCRRVIGADCWLDLSSAPSGYPVPTEGMSDE